MLPFLSHFVCVLVSRSGSKEDFLHDSPRKKVRPNVKFPEKTLGFLNIDAVFVFIQLETIPDLHTF